MAQHGQEVQLLQQLGDSHLQAKQWQPALDAYQRALALLREQQQQQQVQPQEAPASTCQQRELTLQACCAAAMYPQGGAHAEAAVHLLHSVMQQQEGRTLPSALKLYAQIAADQQQWAAAATAAVQLLAQRPQEAGAGRVLARAVQEPSGMQGLLSAVLAPPHSATTSDPHLGPAAAGGSKTSSAAAMAFLASTLLSHGAVAQAVQLLRQAVQLSPGSSQCALGLAQALEVQCDYDGVLDTFLGFCRSNSEHQLGPVKLQAVLDIPALRQLSQRPLACGRPDWFQHTAALRHAAAQPPVTAQGPAAGQDCQQLTQNLQAALRIGNTPSQQAHQQQPTPCMLPPTASQPVAEAAPLPLPQHSRQLEAALEKDVQEQQCVNGAVPRPAAAPAQPCHPAAAAAHTAAAQPPATAVDLHALALAITAAKALFCAGALSAAGQLLQWCQPAEQTAAALQPLHLSSIRNEAAYAGLMRRLLAEELSPLHPPQAEHTCHVLHVCGDSHVLPIAWRSLVLDGQPHLMVPLLITGCKAWHLREGSTHPCAQQFRSALAAVPPGGKVLLVVGEIDCREGLEAAVEKMKYESLDQAVAATVEAYVGTILQLHRQHSRLKVYVHSVPPVLPETRQLVHCFNIELKQQLQAVMQDQTESPQHSMPVFVDLDGVLLQHDDCLTFDGTHLHPCYVKHLQDALSRCAA